MSTLRIEVLVTTAAMASEADARTAALQDYEAILPPSM
jgi:hypothetical protein